jgi:TonB family protein
MFQPVLGEVFTADELARAAGVSPCDVQALITAGEIQPIAGTSYIAGTDAIRIGRRLRTASPETRGLFGAQGIGLRADRRAGLPAFASSAVHAVLIALVFWFSSDAAQTEAVDEAPRTPTRLVFIMTPGPGGGGGGGGLRNPRPPARVQRRGAERLRVSVPAAVKTPVVTTRREVETPKTPTPVAPPTPTPVERAPDPLPARVLLAPVVAAAADPREREGVIERPTQTAASQGPGDAGGAGTGQGTGTGEGFGSGIGEGSGGGTGGGPYRPGSGITPPRLLREVKAIYSEEARRRGLTGGVLLEIVIKRDGSVGDVSVVRGLGAGLEQRAIEAVRQWRFDPARRQGAPVDVIVEVAVEFTLR